MQLLKLKTEGLGVFLFKILLLLKINKLFETLLGFVGKYIIKEMKTGCFLQLVKRKHCTDTMRCIPIDKMIESFIKLLREKYNAHL